MKLVVVGAIVAGMSLAARARRLDENAEIIVFERGSEVSYASCGLPFHISGIIPERDQLLLHTPKTLKQMFNLDVRINSEVVDIDTVARQITVKEVKTGRQYKESYNELAMCTGALPNVLEVPGANLPGIHTLRDLSDLDAIISSLQKMEMGAGSAVVVGAGAIGIETVENLRLRGINVHLVEKADQILPPLDPEIAAWMEYVLKVYGVQVHTGTQVKSFCASDDGLKVELDDGQEIQADVVIQATGIHPNVELAKRTGIKLGLRGGIQVNQYMHTNMDHIWAAGDAVEVNHRVLPGKHVIPMAGPASRQGRVAADNICGHASTYRATLGTSVVQLFGLTAASVGASSAALEAANIKYLSVHVHPQSHAKYYPEATPLHLKVLFSPDDGRILGAQAVGLEGVDKRIDVIAALMGKNGTVIDMSEVELAYAPAVNSVKDPVNMAGFLATSLLRKETKVWYAQDEVQGARIVDVRNAEEVDKWAFPGAENVPLSQIREVSREWDHSQPVRILCAVGYRSYLAQKILQHRGFTDVAFLSGGVSTYRSILRDADFFANELAIPNQGWDESLDEIPEGDLLESERTANQVMELTDETALPKRSLEQSAKLAMVVLSGDLDKLIAAFMLANAALERGENVSMFFTFWGINALRNPNAPKRQMSGKERMFKAIMPSDASDLTLSQMHLGGMGTAMIKQVMKEHGMGDVPALIRKAHKLGAKFTACTMTMDLFSFEKTDLLPGVDFGEIADFMSDAVEAQTTMFI